MKLAYAGTLPLQGTEIAAQWDSLYWFMVALSVFFFVLVVGGMIYFAVRYRSSVVKKTLYVRDNHLIEATWTIIPTILLMVIFGWGYVVYNKMTQSPTDAYEVRVIGKQWLWQFQYDDGRTTVNELYVPANRPVKLIMTSEDVIHSFFIPNFRVKQDVVPGMYSSVWFNTTMPGRHQVFCTEYCGTSHSLMEAQVIALDEQQWSDWTRGKKIENVPANGLDGLKFTSAERNGDSGDASGEGKGAIQLTGLAAQGKTVVEAKGCVACHSADGTQKVGPSFKGVFGHKVELVSGESVTADENYLRESIVNPQAKVVKGFGPVMPTFQGIVSETELNAVIAYLKALK
jgi:cytochrome c oxidase subunit 2